MGVCCLGTLVPSQINVSLGTLAAGLLGTSCTEIFMVLKKVFSRLSNSSSFVLVALQALVFGVLFCFYDFAFVCLLYFAFFCGGHGRDEGRIWGNPEVSSIGVHDVKLPKSQERS